MHIIEQRGTLVLTNGEGTPRRHVLAQALFVMPIAVAIVAIHVPAAMHGWPWAWLVLLALSTAIAPLVRSWQRRCHATLEIDRRGGRVRLERRFAHATRRECLNLTDVTALEIETARRHSGRTSFAPVLALRDGRRIPLGPRRPDRAPLDRALSAIAGVL